MYPRLIFVIGPTNAGKSALLKHSKLLDPTGVGLVEVGKMLRDKYLNPESPNYDPDFFKGEAAPVHTQAEAWNLMVEGVKACENDNHTILIDGQPRDIQQCNDIYEQYETGNYDVQYAHVYAPTHLRVQRAEARDASDAAKQELSRKRMLGDLEKLYEVMTRLINRGSMIHTVCNDGEFSMAALAHQLLTNNRQTDVPLRAAAMKG